LIIEHNGDVSPENLATMVTKCFMMAPNTCWPSLWNLLLVTLLFT